MPIVSVYSRALKLVNAIRAAVVDSTVLQADATKPKPPKQGESATYRVTDKKSVTKATGLERVSAAFTKANAGEYVLISELSEDVEEKYCHYSCCLQTRKLALVGKPWSIIQASDGGEKVAEFCDKMCRGLPSFEESCLDLLDALGKGFSVEEIIWRQKQPVDLIWRHQKKFRFNNINEALPIEQLRLIVPENLVDGIELEPDKYIIHQPKTRSGWKSRGGLIRPVAAMYALESMALQDWARFSELFATPLRVGRYEPGTPDAEIESLKAGLADLGTDAYAVISKLSEITFPSAANSGGDSVQLKLCSYLDAQVSKVVLGHVASADAVAGSLGGAETTAVSVRQDLLEADARALEATFRRDLLAPFVKWNFPEGTEVPYLHFAVEASEDLLARSAVDVNLVSMGWNVPESYVADVYGRPIATDGETTLIPVSAGSSLGYAAPAPIATEPAQVAQEAQGAPVATAPTEAVAVAKDPTTALNGPQVTSLLSIIEMVTLGTLPRDTAVNLINAAFPISLEQADNILGSVGKGFKPVVEAPVTAAPVAASFSLGSAINRAVALPNQNAQGYSEELVRQALSEALPLWKMYLTPVSEAIQAATSFEDLSARLEKVGLNNQEIGDLLARCKLTAQMIGRLEIQAGLGMSLGEMPPVSEIKPLKPAEAQEWLDKRLDMSNEDYKAADDKTRMAAFSLADEQDVEVIKQVRSKIQTALDNGDSLETFQKSLADIEGTDIGQAHAELIFRNAVNKSISAGRYKQQTDPAVIKARPYLQYRSTHDNRVRPNHSALDGKVYRADDEFWSTHYPPNGHNCRCTVVSLSDRQLEKMGLSVEDKAPADGSPDDGWNANPGELE